MIGFKDIFKIVSVLVLTCATVFICAIFVNFYFDLKEIANLINDPATQALYDAQLVMSGIIIACAGGVMGAVTLVVLLFSIRKFILENSANMGVLKALGYSQNRIALGFLKYGLSIMLGCVAGYFLGFLLSPLFYNAMAGDMPQKIIFGFNIETILFVIVMPTLIFSGIAVLFAMLKLREKPLDLILGRRKEKVNNLTKKLQAKGGEHSFLKELKRTMLYNNLLLIFFVLFASFGFSAQIQMSFSMRELTPNYTTTVTLIIIGIVLGSVTLLLAFSHLFQANKKYLALLKSCGYTEAECNNAIFGGYRIVSYIGFAIGTGYQFILVKLVASLFAGSYEIPEITFNLAGFFITLAAFVLFYEILMIVYKKFITSVPLRNVMNS